MFDVSTVLL